jgi:hypothetical protein
MWVHLLSAPGVLVIWLVRPLCYPGPALIDFGDQMGTGMSNVSRGRFQTFCFVDLEYGKSEQIW